MKTKEELNTLKEEVEALSDKLSELTEDELEHVTGGLADFSRVLIRGAAANKFTYAVVDDGLRRLHADPPYLDPDCDI